MPCQSMQTGCLLHGTSYKEKGIAISVRPEKDEKWQFYLIDDQSNTKCTLRQDLKIHGSLCDLLVSYIPTNALQPVVCLIELKGTDFGEVIHGVATRNGDQSVEVLLYKLYDNNPYNNNVSTVNLIVKNLPFKKYFLEYYLIDENHSNAYYYWRKMNSPYHPTAKQVNYLQSKDDLEMMEPIIQSTISENVINKTNET